MVLVLSQKYSCVGSIISVQMHLKCNFLLYKCAGSNLFVFSEIVQVEYVSNWTKLKFTVGYIHPVKTTSPNKMGSLYFFLDCIASLMSSVDTILACALMIMDFRTVLSKMQIHLSEWFLKMMLGNDNSITEAVIEKYMLMLIFMQFSMFGHCSSRYKCSFPLTDCSLWVKCSFCRVFLSLYFLKYPSLLFQVS